MMYAAVLSLSLLLVVSPAVECKETTKPDIMMSSDMENSHGLERINPNQPVGSVGKPNSSSSTVPLDEHRNPEEKMKDEQKQLTSAKGESVDLINIHDDKGGNAADEAPKKASSHEEKLRSNSTSSSAENSSSRHPLFADHHQKEGASGAAAVLLNSDSNSSPESPESMAHEHVERYQLHQSSEEDTVEDSNFKAPISGSAHGKVPESVVGHSGALPIRHGPNLGNGNINSGSGVDRVVTFRKPIPIVRQEAV